MLAHRVLLLQEYERREQIRQHNRIRRLMRENSDVFSLPDQRFIDLFRLTKNMVRYLFNELIRYMRPRSRVGDVSPENRIMAALHFFATGSYQRTSGTNRLFPMSQQSVGRSIKEVSQLINQHIAPIYIVFPTTARQKNNIKQSFMEQSRFPGVIGCVDCTHVALLAPTAEEHNYVCDSNLKILSIFSRYAGATHDSYIWRNSMVHEELRRCFINGDHNSWLLGDSGYPQQPWLMVPIQNALPNSPEDRYNHRHTATRNCIERCIGVLKSRFRCLLEHKLHYSPENVGTIMNTCATLHNICTEARLLLDNEDIIYNDENNFAINVPQGQDNQGFIARRNLIAQYFA
ncbi:hypothetical protein NQ315_008797 [Exocentrus adspersus]|uniref:DDE Tnp4 domain-containing protein n=1 Tax=Exocentrus adspersus TaxID=1586481 RepID=A0AAV8VGS8_9CUCU|nr:hypothetical protein NQ315_008797 [Exocentrus adspersus]